MDPGNPKIIAGMLRCLLQLKRFEDANEMFESFDESILKDEDILKIKKLLKTTSQSNLDVSEKTY